MQRKYGVLSKKIYGKYIALKPGEGYINEFNETAGYIWDLLKKPISEEQISEKLCETYDVKKDQADKDVHEFIMKYTKEGLVTDSPKPQ